MPPIRNNYSSTSFMNILLQLIFSEQQYVDSIKKKKTIVNLFLFKVNNCFRIKFKNASAFLLRDARHAMHDILLLRISAILPEAISDGGLTPTTDTDLLLATYRGGSHLTSDIITFDNYHR